MNLGIYIPTLADQDQLKDISECINTNIGKSLTDASIFFDNIGYNPFNINCGLFNSTDLWNFKGTLITTSLATTLSSIKIVNNIDIYYYYGLEKHINPLSLLYLKDKTRFICKDDDSGRDLFRKTKIQPQFVSRSFVDLIQGLIK